LVVASVAQSGNDATITGGVFDAVTAARLRTERAVLSVDSPTYSRDLNVFVDRLLAAEAGGVAVSAPDSGGDGSGFGLRPSGGSGGGVTSAGGSYAPPSSTPQSLQPTTATNPDDNPRPGTVIGWTMIGLGGAAVATGAGFGIWANKTHNDFLATSQASPDLSMIQNNGKQRALIADICMFGGAGLVVGGIITLLVSESHRPTAAELLRTAGPALFPLPGGGGVGVVGELP
jgi:hypothetical protein